MGNVVVPFVGPQPCDILLVGERPGYDESHWQVNGRPTPTPFVGASGEEQDKYLMMQGLHRRRIRIGNLVGDYDNGRNPSAEDIQRWEQRLHEELVRTKPKFILSVGAYSTRWFLGPVDMESVHGLPQRSFRDECRGMVIVPCFHPAYGLRDADAKTLVWWDYREAGRIIRGVRDSDQIVDGHREARYVDGGVQEINNIIRLSPQYIAEDTEGLRGSEWGFSVSIEAGTGYVFRRAHEEFAEVSKRYRHWRMGLQKSGKVVAPTSILHNSMWDLAIERALGLGSPSSIIDTMVMAFFLRVEPQGLKALARRHCGMEMRDYEEVIGDAAKEKQLYYLYDILQRVTWAGEKNEPRLVCENDGTHSVYTPQPLKARIEKILTDYHDGKVDKEGLPINLAKRWKAIDAELRARCCESMGEEYPQATLDDIPLETAIYYAGRDPDATLRVYHKLRPKIEEAKLVDRLQLDLDIIPLFEEMQATGIMASRKYFESLSAEMWDKMMEIGSKISHRYNDGRPFNPMSQPQVSALAAARNLKGAKKTKTGKISTSKKSMEHLRQVDDAMDSIFNWREHEKVKDSFADVILGSMPVGVDFAPVNCTIKITRVAQDRISAADPNLTAMPVATELGRRVREGFRLRPDSNEVFVTGDMSQIEMRVMADLSRDDYMCSLFREGRDIHLETAAKIFGLIAQWDKAARKYTHTTVHKMLHRNPTKRAGFGVITGIQGPGLYDQLRVMGVDIEKFCDTMGDKNPVKACDLLIKEWFKVYPRCKGFLVDCGNKAYQHGYVRELGGFIRYLPGVWSGEEYISAEARRQSHSHIISGTAQYMLRRAMRWLKPQIESLRSESGLKCNWIMQIHDEVLFHCHEDLAEIVQSLLQEALTKHAGELRVPIEASTAVAKSWGSLEK